MTTALEPRQAEPSWRPLIAAVVKTGGGSIASGLLSALGTKIIASLLGPGSVALLATLQQLRDGAVTVATANGKTALVQGASALEGVDRREYLRTAAFLFAAGTLLVSSLLLLAPASILRWSRLPAHSESLFPLLALTIGLLSVFVFLTAILNAFREIGKLAWLQLASPLASALLAWPLAVQIRAGRPLELILFLAIPAALTFTAAVIALHAHRGQLREWFQGPGRWWSLGAARSFLSISSAMLVSGIVTTTVLLALRGSITRHEGLGITGQFDAAWNISMNQVTLILGSVQAYYLPTLASAKSAQERARQIRIMLIMATLVVVPAIVSLAALKPWVIGVLYSHQFTASPAFLRFTLLGDYLKVSSWVLATPMLATRDTAAFLGSDLATQAVFFAAAILLARVIEPAEGVAIGFLLSYAVYFALCFGYARIRHGFRLGATGLAIWLTGLLLVAGASASSWSDTSVHLTKSGLWIALAIAFSTGFAIHLRRTEA